MVIPVTPLSGITDTTQTIENKDTYRSPKTFFKDFKYIDDETLPAFMKMIDKLAEVSERLTGKKPSKFEVDTWERLSDLLINELLKATDNADAVSSVPAFLTEVLRRKLLKTKPENNNKNPKGKGSSAISSPQNKKGSDEPTDLPQDELEETLAIFLRNLREEAGLEGLIYGQERIYSKADWEWLIRELKKKGFEKEIE